MALYPQYHIFIYSINVRSFPDKYAFQFGIISHIMIYRTTLVCVCGVVCMHMHVCTKYLLFCYVFYKVYYIFVSNLHF